MVLEFRGRGDRFGEQTFKKAFKRVITGRGVYEKQLSLKGPELRLSKEGPDRYFSPRQQPEGQGSLTLLRPRPERDVFLCTPQTAEGNARRSLPHGVPCAGVTNDWQKALETAKRCTKAREGLYSCLYEVPRAGPPRPPHLLLPRPAGLPSRLSLRDPTPLSERVLSGVLPHPKPRDPAPRAPHPSHEAGALRSGPGAGRVPSPRPLPGSRRQPGHPRPPFPRQPRGRSAAAGARAQTAGGEGAGAGPSEPLARGRARAPERGGRRSGGSGGAARGRGGGAERGAPGTRAAASAAAEPSESPAPAAGMCPRSQPWPGLPLPRFQGPVAGVGVGAGLGLQGTCPGGLGSYH